MLYDGDEGTMGFRLSNLNLAICSTGGMLRQTCGATSSNFSRAMARSYLSITDNFSRFQTYAVLLGNIFITSTLGGKVYSRHGPYVTITREARGMIFDDREDIYSGVNVRSTSTFTT